MKTLTIVRRRGLGFGSAKSIIAIVNGMAQETGQPIVAGEWKTWRETHVPQHNASMNVYLRWGCTTTISSRSENTPRLILNQAYAIHQVNNKSQFAQTLSDHGLGPKVFMPDSTLPPGDQYVLRPNNHSRGRNFDVVESGVVIPPNSYARPLIDKSAEYRVYVMFGKVAAVAQKTVDDPSQPAWNHALGAVFSNVRWDNWDLAMCHRAVQAAALSGLDYAAVDMMVDQEGQSWVIEINSAGSLPRNEDRSPSYRARCVAKALYYHISEGTFEHWAAPDHFNGWRGAIHPGVYSVRETSEEQEPVFRSVRSTQ